MKSTQKATTCVVISKVLELLHMDLMGPMQVANVGGKNYIFFFLCRWFLRYTWVDFLKEKFDTFDTFKRLCVKLKNEKDHNIGIIVRIYSDHEKEFENAIYAKFYYKHGILPEFSTPKTPWQNCVMERKKHTLQGDGPCHA